MANSSMCKNMPNDLNGPYLNTSFEIRIHIPCPQSIHGKCRAPVPAVAPNRASSARIRTCSRIFDSNRNDMVWPDAGNDLAADRILHQKAQHRFLELIIATTILYKNIEWKFHRTIETLCTNRWFRRRNRWPFDIWTASLTTQNREISSISWFNETIACSNQTLVDTNNE